MFKTGQSVLKLGADRQMPTYFHNQVKIDQSYTLDLGHCLFAIMKKELSPKQILAVRCPTCGAAPGKKCELASGLPRTTSHRDRRLIAADSET